MQQVSGTLTSVLIALVSVSLVLAVYGDSSIRSCTT